MKKSSERICFIVNPSSGKNRMGKRLDWLRSQADRYWLEPVFKVTQTEGDLKHFAREASASFDKVIACGGDGTVNRVIAGIAESNTPLGLIPVGSGNDFAKAMGLPKSMEECLKTVRFGMVRSVDLIRVSGDVNTWCANTLGCGLDGWANHYKSDFPWARGTMLYALGVLKAMVKFGGSPMKLVLEGVSDGEEVRGETASDRTKIVKGEHYMVTICNGPVEGGSFRVAPDADFSDGLLDLLLIDRISLLRLLWYLPQFFWGPRPSMKGVSLYRGKSVTLHSELPLAVHCDGEHMGTDIRELSASIHEHALRVVVPDG